MPADRHLSREEAFLLVGLLVADADGKRLAVEVDTLLRALQRRGGARVGEDRRRAVVALAAQLRDRGLPSLLGEVSRGLPRQEDRLWAFGLAVEVAYADRHLHDAEAEHIADIGDALSLPEDDVRALARQR